MAFRWQMWHQSLNADRMKKFSFGFGFGYWPCLLAPYIRFDVWHVQIYFWFGLPSYQFQRIRRFYKERENEARADGKRRQDHPGSGRDLGRRRAVHDHAPGLSG